MFAVVTGDPGIGKSRLCAELAAAARSEGATVLLGRCSQDEGAPPLYPWAKVLSELGHDLPSDPGTEGSEDSSSRFRAWEAIARTVHRRRPGPPPPRRTRRPALGGHLDAARAAAAGRVR